jgi:hypothetical protein
MDAYLDICIRNTDGSHSMAICVVGVREGRPVLLGFDYILPPSVQSVYWSYGDDGTPDDRRYHCECQGRGKEHCPLHSPEELKRINAELLKADDRSLPQE